jgi:glycerophosphoryl diester phosphodiesterase
MTITTLARAFPALLLVLACQETLAIAPDYVCEAVELTVVPQGQKLIIAHRGATRDFVENSEEALLVAADYGANSVELDVIMSADGVPVVMHDYSLARTTDCVTDVRGMTWAQISACRLDGDLAIPRLDELLPKLLGYRKVFVEIKCDDGQAQLAAETVGGLVRDLVAYDQVIVTSFNLRALYELKTRFPEPRIHIAYDGQDATVPLATVNMGFDYMLMRYSDIDRCVFSTAEQMRVKLVTYTVTDRSDLFAVNEGLFREHAYGVMFDNLETLTENRGELEQKLGKKLGTPRQCKDDGHVWDKEKWECVEDACSAASCQAGETCDPATGLCTSTGADVAALQALFASLAPVIEAGRAAFEDGDATAMEAATTDLQALIDPTSPYHERVDLLAGLLFSAADPRADILDWTNLGSVVVENPRATLATAAGTEWFFWFSAEGWKLGFVQTP